MKNAFFVRQTTKQDWSDDAIKQSRVFIGWAEAKGLIEKAADDDYYGMREIIKTCYYSQKKGYRAAGNAAGQLWNFIKKMQIGSVVLIPCNGGVYAGQVTSDCLYDPEEIENDRAYYRQVEWLHNQPIERSCFMNNLQRAMKTQGVIANISEYTPDIESVLNLVAQNDKPLLRLSMRRNVFPVILNQLYNGHINDHDFERLIRSWLVKKGYDAAIVPRSKDIGTDIEAYINLVGGFRVPVFVQVKQYQPDSMVEKDVFEKLVCSMKDRARYGLVITTGTISSEAESYLKEINESDEPYELAFIGGELLCEELIAAGLFPDFDICAD